MIEFVSLQRHSFFSVPALYRGIANGHLGSSMVASSECEGQIGENFTCSGTHKLVSRITNDLGSKDFDSHTQLYIGA